MIHAKVWVVWSFQKSEDSSYLIDFNSISEAFALLKPGKQTVTNKPIFLFFELESLDNVGIYQKPF